MPQRDTPLTKLRRKRIRIHRALDKLEPLLAGYREKLARVEAEIQQLAPELPLPIRHRTYQPNPHFARGELPRVALAVMREAGEPLPVRVIVRRMLAAKGVKVADRRTLKVIKTRLHNVLIRTDARGLTVKVGSGRETRRGLA